MAAVCSACGISLPDDARYCFRCGTPQVDVAVPWTDAMSRASASLTERVLDMLRNTDQGFPALWDLAVDAMALSDPEGIVVLANPAYCVLYGYRPDEVIGQSFALLYPEEQRAAAMASYRAVFQGTKTALAYESTVRRSDGSERVVEVRTNFLTLNGQRVLMLSIIRDITASKRAEVELQVERDQLQQIINVLPAGLVIIDASGQFEVVNPAAREMYGQDFRGYVLRASHIEIAQVAHPDHTLYAPDELPITRALRRGETVIGEQLITRNQTTGQEIWLLVNAAPLRDANGQITRAVGVLQEISALRALERLRDEWTSVIAHDLRQPLTVIIGYVTLLRHFHKQPTVRAREQQILEHITLASRTLTRMIGDLLDATRIEWYQLTLEREVVDLSVLLHASVESSTLDSGQRRLRLDLPGNIAPIEIDPMRFEQIVGNLLRNAVKYSPPESEIRVAVEQRIGEIEIAISNEGKGIAPQDIPTLFSRFHRVRQPPLAPTGGLGLGLFIAKGLVELHGGQIWVESILGKTTTFHFTLPRQRN